MAYPEIEKLALQHGVGEVRAICPFCSHERKKKNIKDLKLTVHEDHAVFYCHHCLEDGATRLGGAPIYQPKQRSKPMPAAQPMQENSISSTMSKWLKEERHISAETAEALGCRETVAYFARKKAEGPAISFGYYNKGNAYAYKLRAFPDKEYTCNGSPQTMFNSHNVEDWSDLMIVEGEMDVLACEEAGVKNVTSVPHGALNKPLEEDSDGPKMRFLKHHSKELAGSKKVVICTDNDEPGDIMANELARRIGRDKCWRAVLPEGCKDANDVLIKHGHEAMALLKENAQPWPIEGLHDAKHFSKDVMDMWSNGLGGGEDTGLDDLDAIYSVMPGQLTVVTGHPSNGKSEWVDQMMVHLAEKHGWKFGVCSFENEPRLHIANLATKYIGMPFFDQSSQRMTEMQRDQGLRFVNRQFSFLYSDADELTSLDSILERLRVAVLRHDIRGCVIDPYNYIAKPRDKSETEWVSEMLSRIRKFAQAHGIHVFFVAHPTKMQTGVDGKMSVPKGNDISGSAAWWAKADMGITVHRPDPVFSNETEIHVWKSRFSWCGKQGVASVYYNDVAHRYVQRGDIVRPKIFT